METCMHAKYYFVIFGLLRNVSAKFLLLKYMPLKKIQFRMFTCNGDTDCSTSPWIQNQIAACFIPNHHLFKMKVSIVFTLITGNTDIN